MRLQSQRHTPKGLRSVPSEGKFFLPWRHPRQRPSNQRDPPEGSCRRGGPRSVWALWNKEASRAVQGGPLTIPWASALCGQPSRSPRRQGDAAPAYGEKSHSLRLIDINLNLIGRRRIEEVSGKRKPPAGAKVWRHEGAYVFVCVCVYVCLNHDL